MMEYRFGKSSLAFACVVVLSAFATSSWAHGPSGTVEIEETQAMLILGGDWGHGTLHFNGKDQKFKSKGVKLGGIGVHKLHMHGSVYDLNTLSDFEGAYFIAEAGITVAKGTGGMWMKNGNGVSIHLRSGATGLALSIGVEGYEITLE